MRLRQTDLILLETVEIRIYEFFNLLLVIPELLEQNSDSPLENIQRSQTSTNSLNSQARKER
jgi:hypothetical protein